MKPNRIVLLALSTLALMAAAIVYFKGVVMVRDNTGEIVSASFHNGENKQPLVQLPFGFFYGIPEFGGGLQIVCRDGNKKDVGYVTPYHQQSYTFDEGQPCG